jgi:hypothetical protein
MPLHIGAPDRAYRQSTAPSFPPKNQARAACLAQRGKGRPFFAIELIQAWIQRREATAVPGRDGRSDETLPYPDGFHQISLAYATSNRPAFLTPNARRYHATVSLS